MRSKAAADARSPPVHSVRSPRRQAGSVSIASRNIAVVMKTAVTPAVSINCRSVAGSRLPGGAATICPPVSSGTHSS